MVFLKFAVRGSGLCLWTDRQLQLSPPSRLSASANARLRLTAAARHCHAPDD